MTFHSNQGMCQEYLVQSLSFDDLFDFESLIGLYEFLFFSFTLLELLPLPNFVSFFLQILFITETFVYMPVFQKGDMLKKKMLYHTKFSYCFILPLIGAIFVPRLLHFTIFNTFGLMTIFLMHTICFAILIGIKYRDEWRKNKTPLVQSWFTSMFAPCIVMSPDSNLLLLSSLVSTVPHVIMFAFGQILERVDPRIGIYPYIFPFKNIETGIILLIMDIKKN